MFDFVWHLRGSVSVERFGPSEVIFDRLEHMLLDQYKTPVRGDSSVSFDDPLWENFFTPNWLSMVLYDQGHLWVEQNCDGRVLRYDFRSLHGFIFCVLGGFLFLSFAGSFEGLRSGFRVGLFAFSWLYGANMVLAWIRIPLLIRKTVRLL